MDTERWSLVKSIFQDVLEQAPAARTAFLEGACGADVALRSAVLGLLAADEDATNFLETPALEADMVRPPASTHPERVGAYRICRELGRGGMGTVYLAERADGAFEQQVALKIARRGLDTTDLLSRFRYERQILASLEHPNIASLHDGGLTDDGQPYFVMEYVDGMPLTAYCDQHRLTTRQRLALFRTVCRAVQYAHQNLIVHRDLKPSNILVTEEGIVKLLDFGIAKLLDDEAAESPQTRTGQRLMTPEYASPEQIRGEAITTATDVYQLGVLLYELLTGRRPYRLGERLRYEVERVILEEDPTRPSTVVSEPVQWWEGATTVEVSPEQVSHARGTRLEVLRRLLRGDLDTIVLKALQKDPTRRYASAEQLSEDLRRHLSGHPVLARPDTLGYRIGKYVQRHKVGVVASAIVLLSLLGGMASTRWQARVAAQERDRAQAEAVKAAQVSQFLQQMLASADPYKETDMRVTDVLEAAAHRIDTELPGLPDVEAAVRRTIGYTYLSLGRYDDAALHLERAFSLLEQHAPPRPTVDVAQTLHHMALLRYYQADYEASDAFYHRALAAFAPLASTHPHAYATALNDYSLLLIEQGAYQAAIDTASKALDLFRVAVGEEHFDAATAYNNLALAHDWLGDAEMAEQMYRRALALFRHTVGDEHPDVAVALNNLAFVQMARGDSAEALTLWKESLDLRRRTFGDEHPDVGLAHANLGRFQLALGDLARAEENLYAALAIFDATLPPDHPRIAHVLNTLGLLLTQQNNLHEAEQRIRAALLIYKSQLGPDHQYTAGAEEALGLCLLAQHRYAEAEPLLLHNYELVSAQLDPSHHQTQEAIHNLVTLYEGWGRPEHAARYRALLAE